jgi:hypothetical protein
MGIPQYNEPPKSQALNQTDELVQRFGRLDTLDDLIRLRAADAVQEPILAYPQQTQDGVASYEFFTGEDLDAMVDQAVCTLLESGIRPVRQDALLTQDRIILVMIIT